MRGWGAARQFARTVERTLRASAEARWFTTGTITSAIPLRALVDGTEVTVSQLGSTPAVGDQVVIGVLRGAASVSYVALGPVEIPGVAVEGQVCVAGLPDVVEYTTWPLGVYTVTVSGYGSDTVGTIDGTSRATITPAFGFPPDYWIEVYPDGEYPGGDHESTAALTGDGTDQEWTVDFTGQGYLRDGTWTILVGAGESGETSTVEELCLTFTSVAWPPGGTGFSSAPGVAIPDLDPPFWGEVSDTIEVTGLGTSGHASGVLLSVEITHTYPDDLRVVLIDPDGNEHNVYTVGTPADYETGSGLSIATGLLDVPAPGPDGTWTLTVYDTAAADVGTLDSWALLFPA
jgi:hypothetical protein